MLSYTELKKGLLVDIDGQPYEIIDTAFLRMQQRKAVVQAKFKNLINGKIMERNIHSSEEFEEVELEKEPVKFLYSHKDELFFSDIKDTSKRFSLTRDTLGDSAIFLKPNMEVVAWKVDGKILLVKLPIKVEYKVKEAPPSDKGDTATGGRKVAEIETGAKITVPLFVNTDDVILVNTETTEYVERVSKS